MTDTDRAKQLATALNMSSGEWLDASSRALEPWATLEQRQQFLALARQRADMASELVELLER